MHFLASTIIILHWPEHNSEGEGGTGRGFVLRCCKYKIRGLLVNTWEESYPEKWKSFRLFSELSLSDDSTLVCGDGEAGVEGCLVE